MMKLYFLVLGLLLAFQSIGARPNSDDPVEKFNKDVNVFLNGANIAGEPDAIKDRVKRQYGGYGTDDDIIEPVTKIPEAYDPMRPNINVDVDVAINIEGSIKHADVDVNVNIDSKSKCDKEGSSTTDISTSKSPTSASTTPLLTTSASLLTTFASQTAKFISTNSSILEQSASASFTSDLPTSTTQSTPDVASSKLTTISSPTIILSTSASPTSQSTPVIQTTASPTTSSTTTQSPTTTSTTTTSTTTQPSTTISTSSEIPTSTSTSTAPTASSTTTFTSTTTITSSTLIPTTTVSTTLSPTTVRSSSKISISSEFSITATQSTDSTTTTVNSSDTFTGTGRRLFCDGDCGDAAITVPRIIGGEEATISEYPWQVLIRISSSEFSGQATCGGSIIKKEYILTAAHCLINPETLNFFQDIGVVVTAAEHDTFWSFETNQISILPTTAFVHPLYKTDANTEEHDIALLYLGGTLVFDSAIKPICMPTHDDYTPEKEVIVTGWGVTEVGGFAATRLREVTLNLKSPNDCKTLNDNAPATFFISDNMICALADEKDSCQGDSGSPLVTQASDGRWVQLGIVSFGYKCAEPNVPGFYTKVANYIDWIANVTQSTEC